jgi:DNA-binding transcriptional LysR family regulator
MLRQAFEDLLNRENLSAKLQIAAEVDSSALALEIVRAGFGVALVPIGKADINGLKGLVTIRSPKGLPNIEGTALYRPDPYLLKLEPVGLGWANFQVMRRTNSSLMKKYNVDPKIGADQPATE